MQIEETASSPNAPKGLKQAGLIAVALAIGTVVVGIAVRSGEAQEAQTWSNARSVPTVHLVSVGASAASDALTLPGTMAAWNAARIYARVGGYVRGWYKDIGAEVGSGTPLGSIETPELDQQIAQARAALTSARANESFARSTAARWNDLLTDHSVSEQDADEKNSNLAVKLAAVKAAEADLNRLLAMKAYATVRAPFAGVVTARNADIGDLVGPGATNQQPMFSVADIRRIRLYVNVPQSYSAAMRPGLAASLTVPDRPGQSFDAHVVGTSDAIDPHSGTLQVQLVADNPGGMLKPGGYTEVKFAVPGQSGTVTIPSSALVFRAAGTQVAMVGPDKHVSMRRIVLGRDLGGTVEVVSGLSRTARIVDNPPDSISQGELVRVAEDRHG